MLSVNNFINEYNNIRDKGEYKNVQLQIEIKWNNEVLTTEPINANTNIKGYKKILLKDINIRRQCIEEINPSRSYIESIKIILPGDYHVSDFLVLLEKYKWSKFEYDSSDITIYTNVDDHKKYSTMDKITKDEDWIIITRKIKIIPK